MIKFSILILTYNRPDLVPVAVESILNQSYQNFEILLLDNGSRPPLDNSKFSDPRIRFFRNENNIQGPDSIFNEITGSHFLWLADDDALIPHALEIVKTTFDSNPDIDYIGTGLFHYDHVHKVVLEDNEYFKNFSGKLESYDAWETMLYYFNTYWGIGEKRNYRGPKAAHPSGCFLKKDLIEKTRSAQKELFIKSFGDVGYIGTLLHTNTAYYLDLPLAIIGQTSNSDSVGIQLGNRLKIDPRYQKNLEYTPLKGLSFTNIAVDTHLRVIHRNKLETKIDCKLRPQFYFMHFQSIITDSPWTGQTIRDINEVVPHLAISLLQVRSINGIYNTCLSAMYFFYSIFWSVKRKVTSLIDIDIKNQSRFGIMMNQSEKLRFSNINDAGKWVDENYIKHLWLIN